MPPSLTATRRSDPTPTVLVVDDEILIRLVIADYLRECGYRVFEAGGPEDAVSILQSDLKIDIVFTDLELPGQSSGLELARWIRRRYPAVKVILTSGFTARQSSRASSAKPARRSSSLTTATPSPSASAR